MQFKFLVSKFRFLCLLLLCLIFISCSVSQQKKTADSSRGVSNSKNPVTRFAISTTRMELGDTAWLSWEIEAADSILLDSVKLSFPFTYKIPVTPDTFTSYTMIIYRNEQIPKKRKVSVDVYKPQATLFNVPDTSNDEQDITLEWRTRNAQYVLIDGVEGKQKLSGTLKIKKDTTTNFVLKAIGKYNTDSISKTTSIRLVEKLKYSKPVYCGEYFPIDFTFKRADSIKIDGVDSTFKPVDRALVKLYNSEPVVFTIYRIYGKEEKRYENVDVLAPQLKISGSKTLIKGETGIISWNVRGGDSIRFMEGTSNLPRKGQINIYPEKDTSLTFIVFNGRDILPETFFIKVVPYRKYISKIKSYKALKPDERIDMKIFHASTDSFPTLINLDVFVFDTAGNYISGIINNQTKIETGTKLFGTLSEKVDGKVVKKDFKITEKDTTSRTASNIVYVADYGIPDYSYISAVNNALFKICSAKDKDDKISLIKFGQNVKLITGLQQDARILQDSLNSSLSLRNNGGSCLYAALYEACNLLSIEDGPKTIVLLVSKDDNQSLFYSQTTMLNAPKIASLVQKNNIRIFVVCTSPSMDLTQMQWLADQSGGIFYYVPDMAQVNSVLSEIQLLIHNYYQISYSPERNANKQHIADLHYINRNYGTSLASISFNIPSDAKDDFYLQVDSNSYWFSYVMGKKVVFQPQTIAFFDINSDSVSAKYAPNMNMVLDLLRKNPMYSAILIGHSDLSGSDIRCDELSKERAGVVEKYLTTNGISKNRIVSYSKGKSAPIWSEESSVWQAAENRRVEVIIVAP